MKTCSKCRTEKPTSEFNRSRTKRDGLKGRCRECEAQARAQKHPCAEAGCTRLALGGKSRCDSCRDAARVEDRECVECGKAYRGRLTGGEPKCAACARTPARKLARAGRNKARQALVRGALGPADVGLSWQSLWDEGETTCWICGGTPDPEAHPQSNAYPSLDHLVPVSDSGYHLRSNAAMAHRGCNSSRGATPVALTKAPTPVPAA